MSASEIKEVYPPFEEVAKGAHIRSLEEYQKIWERSVSDEGNEEFWKEMGDLVDWIRPFDIVKHGSFEEGDIAWYLGGQLNASYQCLDRHVHNGRADKVAILWEDDSSKEIRKITYAEALRETCRMANLLRRLGVKKGDTVCLYMPMVPETVFAMLACARLGAPHSVVFAGFSADSLRNRILDCRSRVVLTSDEGLRAGRKIPLKQTVDRALQECPDVESVVVLRRTGADINMKQGRDIWYHEAISAERPYCPVTPVDSEHPLFMLYTSGSTGSPKGIQHSTAGYMVMATLTSRYVFDLREEDVYACVADVGWITGHTYVVYGPLSNGATTFMFESTPLYPDAGRYWDMVERHKITQFYTAPTAIRSLMRCGEEFVKKYDRSTLRVLGSVGEPINPEAWRWYFEVVGDSKVGIVDTYWQTENGAIIATPLPGITPMKPGAAMTPFFGIDFVLMDDEGKEVLGNDVQGVLSVRKPWPGIARTIFGDHQRFLETYMTAYPGTYFTGDGALRDKDGHYFITGRVDDVVNVSGHRMGSAEIESALATHSDAVEAAVVGIPHPVKGQSLFAYVIPREDAESSPELLQGLKLAVRREVGGFAVPDDVLLIHALPKTRSGKVVRRLLRKIAADETHPDQLGDMSTLADPHVVEELIQAVADHRKNK